MADEIKNKKSTLEDKSEAVQPEPAADTGTDQEATEADAPAIVAVDLDDFEVPEASAADLELPELNEMEEIPPDEVMDDHDPAVKMAFIGSGQGGCRIVDNFYKLGYRRVVAINTTAQDMTVSIPDKNCFCKDTRGGAGKDPEVGEEFITKHYEEAYKTIHVAFGEKVEQIIICVGGGGGTGTGTCKGLVQLAKDYLKEINADNAKVGVLITLPKKNEGKTVQKNAYKLVNELIDMAHQGDITPLIIADNQSIQKMFPSLSIKAFWPTVNKSITGLFDIFNLIAKQKSDLWTLDKADYQSILGSGILIFGMTKLKKINKESDISDAVRLNLSKNLLAEGCDLKKATHMGLVVLANVEMLEQITEKSVDTAVSTMKRVIGDGVIHKGVYEGSPKKEGVFLYTIVGGVGAPKARLDEMRKLAEE